MTDKERKKKVKNRRIVLAAVTVVCALTYLFVSHWGNLVMGITDTLFIVGICYLCVGLAGYVRNVGLFKTFGYMAYKTRNRRVARDSGVRLMDLAEYNEDQMQESKKWPVKSPLCVAIPALALSFILAYTIY